MFTWYMHDDFIEILSYLLFYSVLYTIVFMTVDKNKQNNVLSHTCIAYAVRPLFREQLYSLFLQGQQHKGLVGNNENV